MNIDPILTCPLGSKCEEIRDNTFYRCAWYIEIAGKNPQSEDIIHEKKCALAWTPILLIENAQMARGVNESVASLRDETLKRQDQAIAAMVEFKDNSNVRTITHN